MFFTPFVNSEVIVVTMFLLDLTLLFIIYRVSVSIFASTETSFYCDFIYKECGFINNKFRSQKDNCDSKSFVNIQVFRINIIAFAYQFEI